MSNETLMELKKRLYQLSPGKVDEFDVPFNLLGKCWSLFDKGTRCKIARTPLNTWAEGIQWIPPNLCIDIEHNGEIPKGSIRRYIECWYINIEDMTAIMQAVIERCYHAKGHSKLNPLQRTYFNA